MREVALPRAAETDPVAGWFEFWPGWLFHTPIVAWWIALGLWHGDQSLPTAANPRIPVGGLCGESKSDILAQVAPAGRAWIAPWVTLEGGEQAEAAMA